MTSMALLCKATENDMNRLVGKEKPTSPPKMVSDELSEKIHVDVRDLKTYSHKCYHPLISYGKSSHTPV